VEATWEVLVADCRILVDGSDVLVVGPNCQALLALMCKALGTVMAGGRRRSPAATIHMP
jgi:hypothetical protein